MDCSTHEMGFLVLGLDGFVFRLVRLGNVLVYSWAYRKRNITYIGNTMSHRIELQDVTILAIRPDSVKIEYGDVTCSLPRSEILFDGEEGDMVDMSMPEWLAKDRDLL